MLELVDEAGATIGQAEKLAAHTAPGQLHRAFSVFLFDRTGRMLVQRRSLTKYHSPGVWSNSCCGHPFLGELPYEAAARRVSEELGVTPRDLKGAGTTQYHCTDPDSGLIEREYNHLFVGMVDPPLNIDPTEVVEFRFFTPPELREWRVEHTFSVWFSTVLAAALPGIRRAVGNAQHWEPETVGHA
nr:isopentenyl-diphosphate Delta-isomerase [Frankia sp. CiP3]